MQNSQYTVWDLMYMFLVQVLKTRSKTQIFKIIIISIKLAITKIWHKFCMHYMIFKTRESVTYTYFESNLNMISI